MTTLRKNYSIGSVIAVALIAAATYNVAPTVLGSFGRHLDNVQKAVGPTEAGQRAAHDVTFKNLCPTWQNATWFERHTKYRKYAWCEEYTDRL
jgi:uncharacterized membrane protein YdfJ with MMPL/SSD domain